MGLSEFGWFCLGLAGFGWVELSQNSINNTFTCTTNTTKVGGDVARFYVHIKLRILIRKMYLTKYSRAGGIGGIGGIGQAAPTLAYPHLRARNKPSDCSDKKPFQIFIS